MIIGIQIIGLFFGLFMIYYTFLNFKRKEITIKEFSFWTFLWVIFLYVSLFPKSLEPIVEQLMLGRTMDLFTIAGFMLLIFMFFYTYLLVRQNQRKLEQIVRNMAKKRKY
jgi:hypothetical protein